MPRAEGGCLTGGLGVQRIASFSPYFGFHLPPCLLIPPISESGPETSCRRIIGFDQAAPSLGQGRPTRPVLSCKSWRHIFKTPSSCQPREQESDPQGRTHRTQGGCSRAIGSHRHSVCSTRIMCVVPRISALLPKVKVNADSTERQGEGGREPGQEFPVGCSISRWVSLAGAAHQRPGLHWPGQRGSLQLHR